MTDSMPLGEALRVLKCTERSTRDECKASYKQLAMVHHPDKPGGSKEGFQRINEAWTVVKKFGFGNSAASGGGYSSSSTSAAAGPAPKNAPRFRPGTAQPSTTGFEEAPGWEQRAQAAAVALTDSTGTHGYM